MPDLFDCAYYAGLCDGEGYVGIRTVVGTRAKKRATSFAVNVILANTHEAVLRRGVELWGGSMHSYPAKTGKLVWKWQLSSRTAVEFLRCTLPFLVIKREQALIAMQMQERIDAQRLSGGGMSAAERAIRSEMQRQIRNFNGRKYYPRLVEASV